MKNRGEGSMVNQESDEDFFPPAPTLSGRSITMIDLSRPCREDSGPAGSTLPSSPDGAWLSWPRGSGGVRNLTLSLHPYFLTPSHHYFSMIMRHPSHIMSWLLLPPQRRHLRIVGGDKIPDGDSHCSVAQQLSGGIVVRCGNFQDIACRKFVTALLDKQLYGHGLKKSLSVRLRIERRHGLLARHILQDNLLSVVVQVSTHTEQHAVVFHRYRSGLLAFPRRQVITGIAARRHIHPRGINVLDHLPHAPGTRINKRDLHFEIGLVVGRGGRVVHHRLDADFVALLHAISIAGHFGPVRHLAARAENMFFLVGAEKIRAILVPERHVMKHRSRHGVPAGIHELRMIREQPVVHRYFPN